MAMPIDNLETLRAQTIAMANYMPLKAQCEAMLSNPEIPQDHVIAIFGKAVYNDTLQAILDKRGEIAAEIKVQKSNSANDPRRETDSVVVEIIVGGAIMGAQDAYADFIAETELDCPYTSDGMWPEFVVTYQAIRVHPEGKLQKIGTNPDGTDKYRDDSGKSKGTLSKMIRCPYTGDKVNIGIRSDARTPSRES